MSRKASEGLRLHFRTPTHLTLPCRCPGLPPPVHKPLNHQLTTRCPGLPPCLLQCSAAGQPHPTPPAHAQTPLHSSSSRAAAAADQHQQHQQQQQQTSSSSTSAQAAATKGTRERHAQHVSGCARQPEDTSVVLRQVPHPELMGLSPR